ncbi:MAG: sigma-70 family RNA polymerase sigma factor [Gemmatimonadales bacterium]|nr:MAG: sigma-70 family RNA polymerase sigma factor [Gemmatimonadales bacterium]
MPVPSERELIDGAAQGDRAASRALYERYAPRVYAVVRRIAGDEDLAEDAAQEAWIRAFRALPGFRGDARFSTWLHRIAVNSALQGLRGRRRRSEVQETLPDDLPDPGDDESADPLAARRLEAALDRLPQGMRTILVLHDVEGFTHGEIAERLGVQPGTSKSQLFKARARMRLILKGSELDLAGERSSDRETGD